MTVPQMGRAQALSRQFVQRMVNEAAAQGLVESVPNPALPSRASTSEPPRQRGRDQSWPTRSLPKLWWGFSSTSWKPYAW